MASDDTKETLERLEGLDGFEREYEVLAGEHAQLKAQHDRAQAEIARLRGILMQNLPDQQRAWLALQTEQLLSQPGSEPYQALQAELLATTAALDSVTKREDELITTHGETVEILNHFREQLRDSQEARSSLGDQLVEMLHRAENAEQLATLHKRGHDTLHEQALELRRQLSTIDVERNAAHRQIEELKRQVESADRRIAADASYARNNQEAMHRMTASLNELIKLRDQNAAHLRRQHAALGHLVGALGQFTQLPAPLSLETPQAEQAGGDGQDDGNDENQIPF